MGSVWQWLWAGYRKQEANLPIWSQWHGSPLQLPVELLAQILQHVPQSQRMRDCALVCQAWSSAAAAATTQISAGLSGSKEVALAGWLRKYGATAETCLQSRGRRHLEAKLSPVRQHVQHSCHAWLAGLQSLKLHEVAIADLSALITAPGVAAAGPLQSAGQQQHFLAALTSLTRLVMEDSFATDASFLPLEGLSACSNLQELVLRRMQYPSWAMATSTADQQGPAGTAAATTVDSSAVLGLQLQGLVRLSSLHLEGTCWRADALATVSCCTKLQNLELHYCDELLERGVIALPGSITSLHLSGDDAHIPFPEITPAGAPGLASLTNLKTLNLAHCYISPAVLQSMTQLTWLRSAVVGVAEPTTLTALSVLTSLQVLELPHMMWPGAPEDDMQVTAADLAALTASSQLVSLCVSEWQVPPNISSCLLPAGRVLDQLTHLGLGPCFLDSPEAVQQLVSCCPNLESLHVAAVTDTSENWYPEPGTVVHRAVRLEGLDGLQGLTSLCFLGIELDGLSTVWQQLAQLTGLRELHCRAEDGASSLPQLLHLTACKLLDDLSVKVEHAEHFFEFSCRRDTPCWPPCDGQCCKQGSTVWWKFPGAAVHGIAFYCAQWLGYSGTDPKAAAALQGVLPHVSDLCAAAGEFYKQQVGQQQQQLCEQLKELQAVSQEQCSAGAAGTDVAGRLQQLTATIQAGQKHAAILQQHQNGVMKKTVKIMRLALRQQQ